MPSNPFSVPEIIQKLRFYITERSGLYFRDHDLRNLGDAVRSRREITGIPSLSEYYDYLQSPAGREQEFRELLNLLTTNHTYFFRDAAQFRVFNNRLNLEILPRKKAEAKSRGTRPCLRIWSAGCATGEEPYTLAIIVKESLPDAQDWDLEILATDVSEECLLQARAGVYKEKEFRYVPEDLRVKYFEKKAGSTNPPYYEVSKVVKDLVRFDFFNLMSGGYPQNFDVIFCRNVVMYFESPVVRQVMEKIHASLSAEGLLFIGYSESLQFMPEYFDMIYQEEAIYYRRRVFAPEHLARAKVVDSLSLSPEAQQKQVRLLSMIEEAMDGRDYGRAQHLCEELIAVNPAATEPYLLWAECLFHQGEMPAAKEKLERILRASPFSVRAYYWLGRCLFEENVFEEAKRNFKKAIYLDRDCVMAHFFLAETFKLNSQSEKAIREYKNTLKLLATSSVSDTIFLGHEGITVAALLEACCGNLQRLQGGF